MRSTGASVAPTFRAYPERSEGSASTVLTLPGEVGIRRADPAPAGSALRASTLAAGKRQQAAALQSER
jgi:hypothetical protein